MSRITGAKCDDCGKVVGGADTWSAVWRALKGKGWTVDRGTHRCPACSEARQARLEGEARRGPADR